MSVDVCRRCDVDLEDCRCGSAADVDFSQLVTAPGDPDGGRSRNASDKLSEASQLRGAARPTSQATVGGDEGAAKKSQATELVDFATERYSFHCTGAGDPFAIPLDGPYIARMLRGGQHSLRAEMANLYSRAKGRAPSSQACADSLLVLEGRARQGATIEPELRVARSGQSVVVDLGDAPGRAVVIEGGSWTVQDRSPILFRRTGLTAHCPSRYPAAILSPRSAP